MKIGVVTESSTSEKNKDIYNALLGRGHEIINLGMNGPNDIDMNYMHISFIAALLLHTKAIDFMVGGCGTGQGFALGANQFPGVYCGHIADPLDAWLFIQINNGNAVSLAYNKGYGLASDQNLQFIFDALFSVEGGQGYPEHRKEIQKDARNKLQAINNVVHTPLEESIPKLDLKLLKQCARNEAFIELLRSITSGIAARDAFFKAVELS